MRKILIFISIISIFNSITILEIKADIGVGISTSIEEQTKGIKETGHSLRGYEKSIINQEKIISSGVWSATNYVKEDIKINTYTVQLGDTLWEIADGYFGDGFFWVNILNENRSSIGFLPDGSQALIKPGQVLKL